MVPDGSFPTVFSPNPENPEGFALAVKLAKQVKADLIIGTDPDSDRVGMLISQGDEYVHMSGNQTGVLLTDYILGARKRAGRLPNRPAVIKTIVTTELARCVAESYGAECYDTFTGFKYMAELIKKFEETGGPEVVFSFEESFGYMPGTDVRDKDGVSASMLIAEMAAYHISRGGGVMPALEELWRKFGFYDERTRNILMEGVEGQERIRAIMQSLRSSVPSEIGGIRVEEVRDYLPEGSDVLRFSLEGGTMVLVRPSGTEPKLKIYTLARGETADSCAEQLRRTSDFLARWIM
jgi:phosphoglucomutase